MVRGGFGAGTHTSGRSPGQARHPGLPRCTLAVDRSRATVCNSARPACVRSWRIRPAGARDVLASTRHRASRSCRACRVRLSIRIRCGVLKLSCPAYASNSSRMGSSSAEWERVAGVQPVIPDTVGGQSGQRLLQLLLGSGQDGVGTVVGGDRKARELVGQALDTLGGSEHRGHHLRAGCRRGDRVRPSATRRPRRTRPRTEAAEYWPTLWPSTTSGSKAPRLPEPGPTPTPPRTRRAARRRRPVASLRRPGCPHLLPSLRSLRCRKLRPAKAFRGRQRPQPRNASAPRRTPTTPWPCGASVALTGDMLFFGASCDSPRTRRLPGGRPRARRATRWRIPRIDHQCGAVLQVSAARPGGGCTSAKAASGCALSQPRDGRAIPTSAADALRRERKNAEPLSSPASTGPVGGFRCRLRGRHWSFFEDDVSVRPGEPEGADSRNARPTVAFPGGGPPRQPAPQAGPRECGATGSESGGAAAAIGLERQDDLDDTRHTVLPGVRCSSWPSPSTAADRGHVRRPAAWASMASPSDVPVPCASR